LGCEPSTAKAAAFAAWYQLEIFATQRLMVGQAFEVQRSDVGVSDQFETHSEAGLDRRMDSRLSRDLGAVAYL
jgi:hypothetical protein